MVDVFYARQFDGAYTKIFTNSRIAIPPQMTPIAMINKMAAY